MACGGAWKLECPGLGRFNGFRNLWGSKAPLLIIRAKIRNTGLDELLTQVLHALARDSLVQSDQSYHS